MAVSPFDRVLYRDLFTDSETAKLFTDSAEIRAMLLVEGALAKAQGALGLIPKAAAAAIHQASLEVQIDPGALAEATGENGVPVPALVAAFRAEIGDPEVAQYVHWGATSQDIIDTALILRLRPALARIEAETQRLLTALATQAEAHAETPMAARTYGQHATPTSFGATAAAWGRPFLTHLDRLDALRPRLLAVSLYGAAGTSAALGPRVDAVREGMAEALDLTADPDPWHSQRDRIAEFAGWLTLLTGSTAKIGEDLTLLTMSGIGEVSLGGAGASSTMPQKQNPVGPAVLTALARHCTALNGAIQSAMPHQLDRDGGAWFAEWLSLPGMVMAAAKSVSLAADLAERLSPNAETMRKNMEGAHGLIYAEALSFTLAEHMPRPEAQQKIKALCRDVEVSGGTLRDAIARDFSALDLDGALAPSAVLGQAPTLAQRFAEAVRGRRA